MLQLLASFPAGGRQEEVPEVPQGVPGGQLRLQVQRPAEEELQQVGSFEFQGY